MKHVLTEFKMVHSQVLHDVLRRVDRAFDGFFERVRRRKAGDHVRPGYPRFKPTHRYNSITYPQAQKYKIIDGHVFLPKIGKLRVFMHRPAVGEIKTMLVKRDNVGDWFVIPTVELPESPLIIRQSALGIDFGLIRLVHASNGEFVETRKLYQKSEEKLKTAQRQLSHKINGSKNRERARIKVAKIHRKIQRQREYFLHKVSKELVSRADLLVFEDLPIANMVKNHSLSKSICDASWGKLYLNVSYKASSAGKSTMRVDPRGTTSDCAFGNTVKLSPSERVFHCPKCGLSIDRDLHGSFGVLRKVGWEAAELTHVEMRPLLGEKPASPVEEAGSPRLRSGEEVTSLTQMQTPTVC